LGKHSDFVFTENTNSQGDMEKSLLNESDCLTSLMLNSSLFDKTDNPSEHDNEMANIKSSPGVSKSSVSKECFDLLTEFEVRIQTSYSLSKLKLIVDLRHALINIY